MVGGIMNKQFIGALPLVASALGRKYGVRVVIGGDKASTDGKDIFLPSLPLESTSEMISMVRGYLDHESAHICETDFDLVMKSALKPIEKYLWNIIEDYRIERVFSERYPGCRTNFEWLILKFFDRDPETNLTPEMMFLDWVLMTVRSWSVPQIGVRLKSQEETLEREFPSLIGQISSILEDIKKDCPDTASAIAFTKKILQTIEDYSDWSDDEQSLQPKKGEDKCLSKMKNDDENIEDSNQKIGDENDKSIADSNENDERFESHSDQKSDVIREQKNDSESKKSALKSLVSKQQNDLPNSLETMLESTLNAMSKGVKTGSVRVAEVSNMTICELTNEQLIKAKKATVLLKSRLLNLLQGLTLKRSCPVCQGRLDTNLVHRIPLGSSKVFRTKGMRQGLDVAVHLLLDSSGSMSNLIDLASMASYSLCEVLNSVNGVNTAVTAFPGGPPRNKLKPDYKWSTVAPILKHGERLHRKFAVTSAGNTPLAQALWYVMSEMAMLHESRKIVFIMTDGEPDSLEEAQATVKFAQNIGLELFGLGLGDQSINKLLPGRSVVLVNLMDFPRKLFWLLGQAIDINN
jgi:cobalamin biosynthesis protein CobT